MNPKIPKLREELDKNRNKITELQAKNRDLEKKLRELEDTDIIGMVREQGMTLEQFIELFHKMRGTQPTASKEVIRNETD